MILQQTRRSSTGKEYGDICMEKILDKIMAKLVNEGYVKEDDTEIVRYGLELTIMKTLVSAIMLIAAILLKCFIAVLIFMAAYQPMRSCCGGYHAKTRITCLIISMFILAAVIAAVKFIIDPARLYVSLALLFAGATVILLIAPVDTPTKPFDDVERIVFRRRSILITAAAAAADIILAIFRLYTPMLSISIAVFITALLLLTGRASNRKGAEL